MKLKADCDYETDFYAICVIKRMNEIDTNYKNY